MKYRKRPVVVEAIQLTTDNYDEVCDFIASTPAKVNERFIPSTAGGGAWTYDGVIIKTLEGDMLASIGDYIIKGVKGEFYPCKPDIFAQTYDNAEEEEMLTVRRKEAQGLFRACNVASSEPKPAEPKYRKGDKVMYEGVLWVVDSIDTVTHRYHLSKEDYYPEWAHESDLEPYTEPKFRKGQYVFRKKDRSIYVVTSQAFKDGKYRYSLSNLFYEDEDGIELYKPNLLLSPMSLLVNGGQKGWGTMPPEPKIKPISPPKFKPGDKVIFKRTGKVKVVFDTKSNGLYLVALPNMQSPLWVDESDLESYTEPEENVNHRQFIAKCDKSFDNILKDSFAKERRLNIAAMAMQGYLSSNGIGDPKEIAHYALAVADALIKALEEGGPK